MTTMVAATVAILVGAGLYAMLTRDAVRLVIGLVLASYGVNLFVVFAGASLGRAPILPVPDGREVSDPLVQAMVLTAVVIGAGATAVAIGLVYRAHATYGTLDQTAIDAEGRGDE